MVNTHGNLDNMTIDASRMDGAISEKKKSQKYYLSWKYNFSQKYNLSQK